MSLKQKFLSFALLLSVVLSAAQVSPAAALGITGVSPASALNNTSTTVTISGSDFTADVSVKLVGPSPDTNETALNLQSWSETSLVVTVPAGLAPGTYKIRVSTGIDTQDFSSFTVSAPAPTAPPVTFGRPQLQVRSYRTNVGEIRYGQAFNLVVRLENAGQFKALNVQANFTSTDLAPVKSGGVSVIGGIDAGSSADASQQMSAVASLAGKDSVLVDVNVSYYDDKGTNYTEKFTLTVPVVATSYVAAATPTPTGLKRSQLVINTYLADVEILQPGSLFSLELGVQNVGNASARSVTMIVGGGSAGSSPNGTPQPGGVSGGSGEFTNFAPVGTSNIQSLGDFAPGASLIASQNLIVNVSTNPGAYPMKITFSYLDEQGNTINDEQVITLLVYSLPNVDVSFYQPIGPLYAGQPNFLPLQVVNLGRKMSVLGTMKVSTDNGMMENAQSLVGSLEAGGYFTLDAMVYPDSPGPLELTINIDYTDDFNQPRTIVKTLTLGVMEMEMPPFDPNFPEGEGGYYPPAGQEETFLQKAWRFILGLFGLDSGKPVEQPVPMYEEEPMPRPVMPQG
jgi:methionine-rich copper-binding protein CopC